ncbi:MAG: DUF2283 domain-containing protein [Bacteroidetes bacterium]|nr:DUF2283 domain-containing protein [Bacteroidota bacterium]MCL5738449.1 DUF2283 domain-containing protein [Bacteroidota bacterium]
MDKVKLYYNRESDTMDIWFDDPAEETSSEEAGDGTILKKNKKGLVIGVEKLYVTKMLGISQPLPVEVVVS